MSLEKLAGCVIIGFTVAVYWVIGRIGRLFRKRDYSQDVTGKSHWLTDRNKDDEQTS